MKGGGSALGALIIVGGAIWLYFDPNSLAGVLGTLIQNFSDLLLVLKAAFAQFWDSLTQNLQAGIPPVLGRPFS